MRSRSWTDVERWEWFAAGDPEVAPRLAHSWTHDNSAQQLIFETGLVLVVPLLLATLVGLVLSN